MNIDDIKNIEIDKDKLKHLLKVSNDPSNYDEINIKDAKELANIVFDKEIDKLYFLRQYVKDGNDNKFKSFTKSMNFTK